MTPTSTFTPGLDVKWTVQGEGAAAGISQFPTEIDTKTDLTGGVAFTFTPSNNAYFVENRHTVWTKGSLIPNPPISFLITATLTYQGFTHTISKTITQDEIDTLREEYYDYIFPLYGIPIPARSEFVPSLDGGYNSGNYNFQLNDNMPTHYAAILSAYRGEQVMVTVGGKKYKVNIPQTATLGINSGYRDPQHNAIFSSHPDSKHTLGRAFDLRPNPVKVSILINGHPRNVALPLDQVLYHALFDAVPKSDYAQAEIKGNKVAVGTPHEDHIHVQW